MAEYVGSAAVLIWVPSTGSPGTVTLTTDARNIQWTVAGNIIDATAGNDTTIQRLAGIKDGKLTFSGVAQSGTASDYLAVLDFGVTGTATYAPSGTAAGSRKVTFPAMCTGHSLNSPYADVVELACEWVSNGAYTLTNY